MIEFLKEFKDDKRKEELEKMSLSQKMHEEKMSIMNRFLDILSKKEGWELIPVFTYTFLSLSGEIASALEKTNNSAVKSEVPSFFSISVELYQRNVNYYWVMQLSIVIIGCSPLF